MRPVESPRVPEIWSDWHRMEGGIRSSSVTLGSWTPWWTPSRRPCGCQPSASAAGLDPARRWARSGIPSLNRLRPDLFVGLGPPPLLRGDYGDVYVGIGPRASLDNVGQVGLAVAARLPASGIVDVSFAPTGVPRVTRPRWRGMPRVGWWRRPWWKGRRFPASMSSGPIRTRFWRNPEWWKVSSARHWQRFPVAGTPWKLDRRISAGPWQRVEEFEGRRVR